MNETSKTTPTASARPEAAQTTYGTVISPGLIRRCTRRLADGDDWQLVATEELRDTIPQHDDDLDEALEVIRMAEELNEEASR